MIFEKEGKELRLEEFEKLSGAQWLNQLDFENFHLFSKISQSGLNLHKKGKMSPEQLWLGSYFRKEILSSHLPEVAIRWINPELGWGVFALRDFRKMEFIAEYTGVLRKRQKSDSKNAYCFEYLFAPGISSRYIIDALEKGGVGRYINHSSSPNLASSLATLENISRVVFYTKRAVAKGEQFSYDYGPIYWNRRKAPLLL